MPNARTFPVLHFAFCILQFASLAHAEKADPPETTGGSGVTEKTRDVGPLLMPIVNKHDLPGMAGAIIRGNRVVAMGSAGVRRRGGNEKITIDDRFHLGSCTKAMTATLCAMLVEDGKLSWDTTVADVFPELKEKMDPAWRTVTLRQLLTHRAGAPATLDAGGLWAKLWQQRADPVAARQMLLEGVVGNPPEAPPGTKFIYSNAGYAIAGHMAERVMGKPWEQLMRERLFGPLGMRGAGFGPPGTGKAVDQPRGHTPAGDSVEPGPNADNPPAIGPAGTVHCTLSDWARFIALHMGGDEGNAKLLKAQTFKVLHTPPDGQEYAMGWVVVDRPWGGGRVLTHAGSNTMWYCVVWMAPKKDFAVLVACNQGGDAAAKACDEAAAALIQKELTGQR